MFHHTIKREYTNRCKTLLCSKKKDRTKYYPRTRVSIITYNNNKTTCKERDYIAMKTIYNDKQKNKQQTNTKEIFSSQYLFLSENNESSYKTNFLKKLASQNGSKNRYKRYLGSPLRYAGGKSLAVGFILEHFPSDIVRVISPFMGGGSVEIACSQEAKIPVIAYDIFDLLVNYWQVQMGNPQKLAEILKSFQPTKEGFQQIKERLKKHWKKEELIEDAMELAAYYYFNHNTSYGPGFLSWPSSVYMQEKRYHSMIDKVKNTNFNNLEVYCNSFENVFALYPNDFFYCDPPYFLDGNSKMFKGIYPQRNFPIHHNGFRHDVLRDLLVNHNGKFIVSYNDCQTIREWYKDFELVDVAWQYTMGQGETRIGLNRINKGINHIKQSHEVLIIKR